MWLSPVVELLKKKLLEQKYLHINETLVQVLNEPGRNTTDSYIWVYGSIKNCEHPVRYFDYRLGRSRKYSQEFPKGFYGYIHTDAYKGYEKAEGITRCFCWLHLRRNFVDVLPKNVKSSDWCSVTIKGD